MDTTHPWLSFYEIPLCAGPWMLMAWTKAFKIVFKWPYHGPYHCTEGSNIFFRLIYRSWPIIILGMCIFKSLCSEWSNNITSISCSKQQIIHFWSQTSVVYTKLYIPSTLNIHLILSRTQLIVCAVKC